MILPSLAALHLLNLASVVTGRGLRGTAVEPHLHGPRGADAGAGAMAQPLPPAQTQAQAAGKRCFFLHGAGCPSSNFPGPLPQQCPNPAGAPSSGPGQGQGPPTSSFTEYWGNVHLSTGGCASHSFNHDDTINQAFDDEKLRARTCLQLCGGPGCVIADAVIFTHSMGNLYLAAAIAHGDCHLGASSNWFLANPPALGSHAADIAVNLCHSGLLHCPLIIPGSCAVARQVMMEMGVCIGPDEAHLEPTAMIRSLDPAYRGLNGTHS